MHYLVRLIVEAQDAEEANDRADTIMMDLVEWKEFDWYRTKADGSQWGDCWKPIRLDDEKAQAWVKDAMDGQLSEFKQSMAAIRLMLNAYSDEQIFNEEFEQVEGYHLSRYQFSKASGYGLGLCQIFGEGGDSIISQAQLDCYLNDADRLWVVQVDCHN